MFLAAALAIHGVTSVTVVTVVTVAAALATHHARLAVSTALFFFADV